MKTKLYFLLTFFFVAFTAQVATAQCSAAFTHTVSGGTVTFVASVPPIAGQYHWDFGDASAPGYSQNETHSYANAGTYNVCLIVLDSMSPCSDTFCAPVTVSVGCNNLMVTVTSTPESAAAACDGSATATVSGGTAPYAYQWSNAATTASIINLCAGTYSVTVVDVNGCVANHYTYVTSPFVCVAGFGANINGNSAIFYNTSSDTANSAFQWAFGDATGATGANTSHTYAAPGTYNVMLIMVSSMYSCTDTITLPVTVGGPSSCYSPFSMVQDSFNLLQWYIYPSITGVAPFTYLWDFGDMTTSTLPNPNHTYALPGQYTVCLSVTDANACTSYFCDSSSVQRSTASLQMQYATVINGPSAVPEQEEFTAAIFPNPAGENLAIVFNKPTEGKIRLTDVAGKIVYEQTFAGKSISIDVSALPGGIYNCNISGATVNRNEKIVVIH
jgi:PKD repeat protein